MTQPKPPKPPQPIADGIPLEAAWKVGRRVYVRCGYKSALNTALRDIGATWDAEVRALWVGSGKLGLVEPLVRAHTERLAQVSAVKSSDRWVSVPFDAADIRAQVKALGGVWDGDRKMWAMPTDEAFAQVSALVAAWVAARDDARRIQREREVQARRDADAEAATTAEERATTREAGIIAASGRAVTDVRGTATGRLHGQMRRAQAEQAKPQPGEVCRLRDGRRALVLACDVEFWGQDATDDGFSPDLSDDPGWFYRYRYAVVEPTTEEAEQDQVKAAKEADTAAIADLMRVVERAAELHETHDQPPVPAGQTITQDAAGGLTVHGGRITLTADGECWWQHPGWYDDYRSVQGLVRDEAVIARVRAVLEAGSRRRGQYQVRT